MKKMRNLIIYASSTTELIAREIDDLLVEKATIIDAKILLESKIEIDFSTYDNIILGTNVLFNRVSHSFKKCAKLLNANFLFKTEKPNIYCYIAGCDYDNADDVASEVAVTLKGNPIVFFVGGSLADNGLQGLKGLILGKIAKSNMENVTPIDHNKIQRIAEMVNGTIL